MSSPNISVLVPIYNVEKYIERCSRSLFEQTLKDGIEYIFVDDCSPDRSIEILENTLEEYPERKDQVKIIQHEKNSGLAQSRLTGLYHAKGKYIAICDSDDWVDPKMYEELLKGAIQENADIVTCNYKIHYKKHQPEIKIDYKDKEDFLNKIIHGQIHNGLWNKLIKKEIFKLIDNPFVPGLNMWEDRNVVPRLAFFSNKIVHINQSFYHYNKLNEGSYTIKWKNSYSENILAAINNNKIFFEDKNIDYTPIRTLGMFMILNKCDYNNFKIMRSKIYPSIDYSYFPILAKINAWFIFNKSEKLALLYKKVKSFYDKH